MLRGNLHGELQIQNRLACGITLAHFQTITKNFFNERRRSIVLSHYRSDGAVTMSDRRTEANECLIGEWKT